MSIIVAYCCVVNISCVWKIINSELNLWLQPNNDHILNIALTDCVGINYLVLIILEYHCDEKCTVANCCTEKDCYILKIVSLTTNMILLLPTVLIILAWYY